MRTLASGSAAIVLAALAFGACESPTDRELVIEGTGVVGGFVFLDVDGSGSLGAVDEPMEGIRVRLVPDGGGGPVTSATTDTLGVFRMDAVPVGGFRLEVDAETVPDSAQVLGQDADAFILADGDTVIRNFRLSFPTYTLSEVRELEPGRRVFTHGIVLNPRIPSGDGVVHLKEGDVHLRATNVERNNAAPRDSVRFSGRTAVDEGQPILTDVRVFMLQPQAVPPLTPFEMSTAVAATADDETRDAALARVREAVILDTVRVGNDLIVTADDGSGPLDVVLRGFIDWNWSAFRPDSVLFQVATGLLVPVQTEGGSVRWRLVPRTGQDVSLALVEFDEEGGGDPLTIGFLSAGTVDQAGSPVGRGTCVGRASLCGGVATRGEPPGTPTERRVPEPAHAARTTDRGKDASRPRRPAARGTWPESCTMGTVDE